MPKPSLCLNMIVKNEAARIERCLRSVLPYVKFAAIVDTGSTDDTKEIIKRVCLEHGVLAMISDGTFENFSQARNDAFRWAKDVNVGKVWCQFALLMDADMELVVDDPKAFDALYALDANAMSYDMMQKGGAVSYGNRRIVNLNWGAPPYVGVTHEYIDIPAAGMITGARFLDHADGSNRVNKFARDAELLEADLKEHPDNGRGWYYLGNTYRDWGKPAEAITAYTRRIDMGGWDEETHSAMMNRAACKRSLGDIDGFVAETLAAYNFRPSRAEPLYDLAKHYREGGDNAAALVFAKTGIDIKRPGDLLFVNDFVYSHGLRYEFAIAGYYSEAERSRAFAVTNDLVLDPSCPSEHYWSARSNLFWFTKPLGQHCPSFEATKLDFIPPHGYHAMNPSVEVTDGLITCNIRCVNYQMDDAGRYIIHGGGEAIDTRNFVVHLEPHTFDCHNAAEVLWNRPAPKFSLVTGLEDIRLWRYCGELHFSATVREQSAAGVCQIAVGRLHYNPRDTSYIDVSTDWRVVSDETTYEKNWMPMPSSSFMSPRFVYRLDKIIGTDCPSTVVKHETKLRVGDISGSSQLIPFNSGFLAVTHEASNDPSTGKRTYWHRFAWFGMDGKLQRLSLPFVFFERQIEFCSGLALHPNGKLLISFGVRDAEAYVATIEASEVSSLLWKFYES